MKKILILSIIICSLCIQQKSLADTALPVSNIARAIPSSIDFSKSYKTTSENLLYLLLSAINAQNYSIEEIQFKTGSVLFKAYSKEFIASVSAQDSYNSYIKIIPADNNYNFAPSLIQKLHNYIEINNSTIFQKIL